MSLYEKIIDDIRKAETPMEILSSYDSLKFLLEKEIYIRRKDHNYKDFVPTHKQNSCFW